MDGLSPALSVQKGMTLSRAHDAAGGFDSLREAYEEVGVDGYYADHGAAYRNPHEPILIEALCLAFSKLEEAGLIDASTRPLRVLDYACGSGEGHLAILNWVDGRSERLAASVTAADPYTYMSYEKRMGYPCQRWSFEDISGGVLEEHPPFDVVVGAFACTSSTSPFFARRSWPSPVHAMCLWSQARTSGRTLTPTTDGKKRPASCSTIASTSAASRRCRGHGPMRR
jgi:hypothetical protein